MLIDFLSLDKVTRLPLTSMASTKTSPVLYSDSMPVPLAKASAEDITRFEARPRLKPLSAGDEPEMVGAVLSSVKVSVWVATLPAVSVSVTTTVWLPSAVSAV